MCEMYNCPVTYTVDEVNEDRLVWNSEEAIEEDKVILETEITLRTGPNITMKIHEESRSNSALSGIFTEGGEDSKNRAIIKVLNDDSETDCYDEARKSPRTPRKVRFGGESVKLRTPESDSSHQAEDDENDSSVLTITVTDAVSITAKRSLIPIRISSLPSSPKKRALDGKPLGKHYQSAPNLNDASSKIPVRIRAKQTLHGKKRSELDLGDTSGLETATQPPQKQPDKAKCPKEPNLKPPILKHSRAEDVLSPVPVHNEIEVFHNLTRSPDRSRKSSPTDESAGHQNESAAADQPAQVEKEHQNPAEEPVAEEKTYNSFQVYEDTHMLVVPKESSVVIEEITENEAMKIGNGKTSVLQQSLSSLTSDDEIWAKSEALESVVKMLKEPGICESLEAGAAALLFEALFACHHRDRLHSLADNSLMILIAGLRQEVLEQCLPRLALSLCKMGASSGVRCALVVMKKLTPKKLQLEILSKGFGHRTREGALQILMACARLYPRQDVEVVRITEFAAVALRDRRRRVRHAALETLAASAQLLSVHETLSVVENTIKDFTDFGEIVQVVRTRLSRKQLPTVDLDGSIRYSSPTDNSESDWIAGSVLKNNVPPSPLSSASSSSTSANYWMRNSRHEHHFNNGSTLIKQLSESNEEDVFEDPGKIWALEADNSGKNGKVANRSNPNILRPVYILQPDAQTTENGKHSRGHRKYDRGRSFSPPKQLKSQFPAGLAEPIPAVPVQCNISAAEKHYSAPDAYSRLHYPDNALPHGFRKSFSSDQLYSSDRLPPKHEPYSFSLSSRSSSTSTGSSTKSGFWHRDLKSGIPVPISEPKLKIKHTTSSSFATNGPLIAKRSILSSPQHTPASSKASPRQQTHVDDHESISRLSLPPPQSSGSESSGYYTPSPPDTHPPAFVKMDTEERLGSDVEEPLEHDCVDSISNKSVLSQEAKGQGHTSRISSAQPSHYLGEAIHDHYPSVESIQLNNNENSAEPRPPSHTLLLESIPAKIEIRRKSKSVIDLPNFLPRIAPTRQNINSAPPRNEDNVVNNNLEQDTTDCYDIGTSSSGVALGSMGGAGQHQEVTATSSVIVRKSKLEKRRLSRHDSRKALKASPRVPPEAPASKSASKPKDVLQHVLTQLENPNWETTIDGLHGLIELLNQSPDTVQQQMHQICIVLAKHIKNLRSQVARAACNTASELFLTCRRTLDMELEDIAIPLLQRTADTNRFLRADANATLDVMCEHLPAHRVIPVVATRGCAHPNSVVRAASVRLLGEMVHRLGAERVFLMPKELRDKLLLSGANALADGNVEARSYGKSLLKYLVDHPNFQRSLREAVPQNILRHISKVLATIKPDM